MIPRDPTDSTLIIKTLTAALQKIMKLDTRDYFTHDMLNCDDYSADDVTMIDIKAVDDIKMIAEHALFDVTF